MGFVSSNVTLCEDRIACLVSDWGSACWLGLAVHE